MSSQNWNTFSKTHNACSGSEIKAVKRVFLYHRIHYYADMDDSIEWFKSEACCLYFSISTEEWLSHDATTIISKTVQLVANYCCMTISSQVHWKNQKTATHIFSPAAQKIYTVTSVSRCAAKISVQIWNMVTISTSVPELRRTLWHYTVFENIWIIYLNNWIREVN